PNDGVYGYEVLAPLQTAAGTVLVDRGWVPNTESADTLPEVAPEPPGEVEVTGWLRPGEPALGRDLPRGQRASVDAAVAGPRLADGSSPERPEPTEPPSTELGPHFAYALQWWLTAPLGFVLVYVFARREQRERWARDNPEAALVAAGRRRSRIWDEEDE